MAYNKRTWVNDSEPDIDADNLNHIEEGIYDATETAENTYTIARQNSASIATLEGKVSDNEGYITNLIKNKADKSTTYTKSEVDGLLSAKADSSSLGTVSAINLNDSTEQYLRGDGTWQTVQSGADITVETSGNGAVISEISANGSVITQTKTNSIDFQGVAGEWASLSSIALTVYDNEETYSSLIYLGVQVKNDNEQVAFYGKNASLGGNITLGGTIMKADGSDYVQSYIDEALGDIGTVLDAINGTSV